MAESGGRDPDELLENVIIVGIPDGVSQILRDLSCEPKTVVKDELVTEVDFDVLQVCRGILFNRATDTYFKQLADHGLPDDKVNLDLIGRRASGTLALDIVELYMYVTGANEFFPKGVLHYSSTYKDMSVRKKDTEPLVSAIKDTLASENTDNSKNDAVVCDNCKDELAKLWAYVYNVEKVHRDRIMYLQNKLGISELINADSSTPNNCDARQTPADPSVSQPTVTGDGVASQTPSVLHTPVADPLHRQPADHREGMATQTTPTISQMLADDAIDTAMTPGGGHRDAVIPCAQPSRSNVHVAEGGAHGNRPAQPAAQPTAQPAAKPAAQPPPPPTLNGNPAAILPPKPLYSQMTCGGKPVFIGPRTDTSRVVSSSNVRDATTSPISKDTGNAKPKMLTGRPNNAKPGNKSDSRGNNNNNKLTGRKPSQMCDLYVQNIERFKCDNLGDIANRVRGHCRENEIKVVNARVIPNKFRNDVVSCKITVPIAHADKAIGIHIWPDGVKCRRWKKDPPASKEPEVTHALASGNGRERSRSRNGRPHSRQSRSRQQLKPAIRSDSRMDRSRSPVRVDRSSSRGRSQSRVRYDDNVQYEERRRSENDYWFDAVERNNGWQNNDNDRSTHYDRSPDRFHNERYDH